MKPMDTRRGCAFFGPETVWKHAKAAAPFFRPKLYHRNHRVRREPPEQTDNSD